MNQVDLLAEEIGGNWPSIRQARSNSLETIGKLTESLEAFTAPDTSVVISGSLARFEMTPGSDIDWSLLLDGPSDPNHLKISQEIGAAVNQVARKGVGKEGTFGTMVSSHNLINYIGGEVDTNSNTTQRSLLLLESRCIGNAEAYNRVKRNLLKRYLSEDSGLWRASVENKLPHFLMNDLARYWRTMTVDYAYKQRTRGGVGIPLRNIKLRMSRKLIYVAGLLACYDCHLAFDDEARVEFYKDRNVPGLVARLHETLEQTPLEITANLLRRFPEHNDATKKLFDAYDQFLRLLLNDDSRNHLEQLHADATENDAIYLKAKEAAHQFRDALEEIFLDGRSILKKFTIKYGVF
ncbi:MAG: hypothetical protein V4555_12965 [Acidobacteriota bacterium]